MYAPPGENVTRGLLRKVLDFLAPAPCLACARPVEEPRRSLGLCAGCRRRLVRWPQQGCAACGRPLEGTPPQEGDRCGPCRRRQPSCERTLAAWTYQPPLDAVLTGLKFRRLEYLGSQLGRELAVLLGSRLEDHDLVVPVPLHWRRRLARGYNQAEAIARPLAKRLGLEHARVLRRRRATPPQTALEREQRVRSVRGAFALRRRHDPRGRRVLLVDDVVTTGATLEAAAACLRRAGAARVTAVAAARTPGPGETGRPGAQPPSKRGV